ncbi:VOC family protein [Gordonia sp. CPCC 205515]|uniref:VOC family protein n=1 Tax=Gordonia sp. CPCC 205515 TaxID=3140791 RepID=UPI003AF339E1
MNLVSVRIITASIDAMVTFYAQVTAHTARWATPDFAEIVTAGGTLAIASERTAALFAADSVAPASNRSVIIEFQVDDVDAVYARLADHLSEIVQAPTTMPWGNRSALFRDPDGNLVNLFTPVTAEALARVAR